MGQAIQAGVVIAVTIKNYRRDGSAFWNFIQVSPLKDAMDKITLIVGVQCEVLTRLLVASERELLVQEIQRRFFSSPEAFFNVFIYSLVIRIFYCPFL